MPIALFVAIAAVVLFYYLRRQNHLARPQARKWLKTGGILGGLIFISRLTRTPLATLLSALPLVLASLQKAEATQQAYKPPTTAQMTRDEALLVLGLTKAATAEEIKNAHRKLMQKIHPDAGGNDYLAAKINQARDILLN